MFLADTRTNAGVDNVGTYRKLHVLRPAPDRVFVLESAGNLATTQEVLDRIGADLRPSGRTPRRPRNLATVSHLFEAALYVGRLSREVSQRHRGSAVRGRRRRHRDLHPRRPDRRRAPPDILLVYPEGNYIRASDDRPFLQIGESKYGKFMLELAVRGATSIWRPRPRSRSAR